MQNVVIKSISNYTSEQLEALSLIKEWYFGRNREQVFRLTGLAGTGKTYLLSHLENELNCTILYLAYTGKACNNLAVKGLGSKTIHSVLYRPVETEYEPSFKLLANIIQEFHLTCSMEDCKAKLLEAFGNASSSKTLSFVRKDSSEEEIPSLLVVDEASMVNQKLYRDLLSLGVKVLLCGDPGQLPPIEKDTEFSVLSHPNFTLKSIQRQQINNPIITLAHKIYNWQLEGIEYNSPYSSDEGMALILNRNLNTDGQETPKEVEKLMLQADQVLCYTNKYRAYVNEYVRREKGYDSVYPVPGDKLICIRNNWNLITDDVPLVNGQIGECVSFEIGKKRHKNKNYSVGILRFRPDYTNDILETKISLNPFDGTMDSEDLPVDRFDFGYAITVHKSQGSEWDNVLAVYDMAITVDNLKEWLYTALTRAKKQVILYLPKVSSIQNIRRVASNR